MKELGMTLLGCLAISIFFVAKVYPNLEYTGATSNTSCTGQCYVDYVALNGTPAEIEQRKKELASTDEFSSIRSLWAGCAACHGADGGGMGPFPSLQGRDASYIVNRLVQYKNKEQVGAMSSTMWAQAGMLSDQDMETIGKFIEAGLPGK
jgi:cytochrome c553